MSEYRLFLLQQNSNKHCVETHYVNDEINTQIVRNNVRRDYNIHVLQYQSAVRINFIALRNVLHTVFSRSHETTHITVLQNLLQVQMYEYIATSLLTSTIYKYGADFRCW